MRKTKGNFSLLILTLAMLASVTALNAASISVNTTADNALSGDSFCTLREAIQNANGDNDTTFGDCAGGVGNDAISFSISGTIALSSTLPDISSNVSIDGNIQSITIDGGNGLRIFFVNGGITFDLKNVKITHGVHSDLGGAMFNDGGTVNITNCTLSDNAIHATFSADARGSAIYNNAGTLNISNSTFSNNTITGEADNAEGAALYNNQGTLNIDRSNFLHNRTNCDNCAEHGVAIFNNAGTLNATDSIFSDNGVPGPMGGFGGAINNVGLTILTNCVFSGNSVGPQGGAIETGNTLIVTGCVFLNNSAGADGGAIEGSGTIVVINSSFSGNFGGNGGAISNGGSLTVWGSTFSNNEAAGSGGAISNIGGVANVTNSTFWRNSAAGDGGAILNGQGGTDPGTVNVTNSTFSGNGASSGGAIKSTSYLFPVVTNTVNLVNTIVAGSTSGGNCQREFNGVIVDGGNNLDSDGTCGFSSGTANPLLDPAGLQNNGGPTQTIALQFGSPAIDAGNDTVCSSSPVNGLDQRGVVRPQGPHCDIGTFELGQNCPHPKGFWKDNPSFWPVTTLTLGSQTYNQAELLILLGSPSSRDASLILAKQLIAAKLNFASGAELGSFAAAVTQGDSLLSSFAGKLPYNVRPSSTTGQNMIGTAHTLEAFNTKNCQIN
jgi:CSLREA domain-containing protein